jgi:hypothetical protein
MSYADQPPPLCSSLVAYDSSYEVFRNAITLDHNEFKLFLKKTKKLVLQLNN